MRLDRAIRRIAEGIVGGERRAHVALSCRVTDWDATRDLAQLSEGLPVPRDPSLPPPPTADELLVGTLRREQRRGNGEPVAEKPLVVLMAPLDPERVRIFAAAHGAADLDALLDQIERANLWRFARRPLDLDWLVRYWRAHGRLGTLAEMLESSLRDQP